MVASALATGKTSTLIELLDMIEVSCKCGARVIANEEPPHRILEYLDPSKSGSPVMPAALYTEGVCANWIQFFDGGALCPNCGDSIRKQQRMQV